MTEFFTNFNAFISLLLKLCQLCRKRTAKALRKGSKAGGKAAAATAAAVAPRDGKSSASTETSPTDADAMLSAVAAADAAAQAHGFPNSAIRAFADSASGADSSAVAIDTFLRYGGVRSVDDGRHVVRRLILLGLLIEVRRVENDVANAPLHRVLCATESALGPLGRVAAFIMDVKLLVPEVRLHCTIRRVHHSLRRYTVSAYLPHLNAYPPAGADGQRRACCDKRKSAAAY